MQHGSKVGQLAANHFATILPDDGWEDRLREVGTALPLGGRPDHRDSRGRLMEVADGAAHPGVARSGRRHARRSALAPLLPGAYGCTRPTGDGSGSEC